MMVEGQCKTSELGVGRRPFQFGLRTLLLITALVCVILGTASWIRTTAFWNAGVIPIPFESEAWKRAEEIEDFRTTRSQMIGDLLSRYEFKGMTRGDIVALLGELDIRGHGNPSRWNGWDIVYYLGLERGGAFSLDNEYLVFRLDARQRVVEYRTTVD